MTYIIVALVFFLAGLFVAALLGKAGSDSAHEELERALEAEYLRGLNNGRTLGRKGDV